MKKHFSFVVVIVGMSMMLMGCESFRKKFVRKDKRKKEVKVVVQTHEYESQGTIDEVYKKYYIFWRAAHDDLIHLIERKASRKKLVVTAQRVTENLKHMRQYIMPEKQKELDVLIKKQEAVSQELDVNRLSLSRLARIKSSIASNKRRVEKSFSYAHIKGYLLEK